MRKHPKISIVTPCYNSEEFLESCIKSIMNQSYDNIEHIIVDGGSTDKTLDIIRAYEGQYNLRWISEPDEGMYDAITKGFSMATGDIFAWLNSDDMYMPWAGELVASVMESSSIEWCIGVPCIYTKGGIVHSIPRITPVFPRQLIAKGYMDGRVGSFMQQESMFWSKELWQKHSNVICKYKYAGDYHLWKAFAKDAQIYTLDSVISGFRVHEGQKSQAKDMYYREIEPLNFWRQFLKKTHVILFYCAFVSLLTRKLRIKTRYYLEGIL